MATFGEKGFVPRFRCLFFRKSPASGIYPEKKQKFLQIGKISDNRLLLPSSCPGFLFFIVLAFSFFTPETWSQIAGSFSYK
jgi:hypothetical protein